MVLNTAALPRVPGEQGVRAQGVCPQPSSPRPERWPLPPRLSGPAPPSLRARSLPLPPAWRNLQPGLRVPREMLSRHIWLPWRLWAEEGTPLPPVVFSHPEAEGPPAAADAAPQAASSHLLQPAPERQRLGGGRRRGAASEGGTCRGSGGQAGARGPARGGRGVSCGDARESGVPRPRASGVSRARVPLLPTFADAAVNKEVSVTYTSFLVSVPPTHPIPRRSSTPDPARGHTHRRG